MMPDYPNGVTRQMMEAGAEVLLRANYVGVALAGSAGKPTVIQTPTAIACALARAFPAMLDKAESGSRDTLLHPGPIGAGDLGAWDAMSPTLRAQYVFHHAPNHLLGIAGLLGKQRISNPGCDAELAFLTEALMTLARQMERAAALQRREHQMLVDSYVAEMRQQHEAQHAKPRSKRKRKPTTRRKAGVP